MSQYLNQIFYKCNKFDNIESISKLEKYMFTNDLLKQLIKNKEQIVEDNKNSKPIKEEISNNKEEKEANKDCFFYPKRLNSLFWCIYIAIHGSSDYEIIGNKYLNKEIEEKSKIYEFFKKTPLKMKESNHKVTKVMIQEILSELMVQNKSSLLPMIAMAIYYNKIIFITKNNSYMCFSKNNEESFSEDTLQNYIIVNYKNTDEYGIDLEITQDKITNILNNMYQLEGIDKPLKGVSTYKSYELDDIAKKLGIFNNRTIAMNKNELYKELCNHCSW